MCIKINCLALCAIRHELLIFSTNCASNPCPTACKSSSNKCATETGCRSHATLCTAHLEQLIYISALEVGSVVAPELNHNTVSVSSISKKAVVSCKQCLIWTIIFKSQSTIMFDLFRLFRTLKILANALQNRVKPLADDGPARSNLICFPQIHHLPPECSSIYSRILPFCFIAVYVYFPQSNRLIGLVVWKSVSMLLTNIVGRNLCFEEIRYLTHYPHTHTLAWTNSQSQERPRSTTFLPMCHQIPVPIQWYSLSATAGSWLSGGMT